jgi:hypothetical protein
VAAVTAQVGQPGQERERPEGERVQGLEPSVRERAAARPLHAGVDVALQELVERHRARGGQTGPDQGVQEAHVVRGAQGSQGEADRRRDQDHQHDPGLGQDDEVGEPPGLGEDDLGDRLAGGARRRALERAGAEAHAATRPGAAKGPAARDARAGDPAWVPRAASAIVTAVTSRSAPVRRCTTGRPITASSPPGRAQPVKRAT